MTPDEMIKELVDKGWDFNCGRHAATAHESGYFAVFSRPPFFHFCETCNAPDLDYENSFHAPTLPEAITLAYVDACQEDDV